MNGMEIEHKFLIQADEHGKPIIELQDPAQPVELPFWIAEEVTNDHRYINSQLSQLVALP